MQAVSNIMPRYITAAAIKDLSGDALPTRRIGRASRAIGTREEVQKFIVSIDDNILCPLVGLFVIWIMFYYIMNKVYLHIKRVNRLPALF